MPLRSVPANSRITTGRQEAILTGRKTIRMTFIMSAALLAAPALSLFLGPGPALADEPVTGVVHVDGYGTNLMARAPLDMIDKINKIRKHGVNRLNGATRRRRG